MSLLNNLFKCFLFWSLISCNHPESEELKEAHKTLQTSSQTDKEKISETDQFNVIGVKDGDTIDLLIDGKKQTVRLAHIDAPEKNQPFGTKAKQFLSDLCFGNNVRLVHNNKYDRNKRLIAEIITLDGININKELVKNGLAWHFKKYSKDETYSSLEINARNMKLGLWADTNPIAPWDWRKK